MSEYVVVEIGCIECGNGSRVLGIFDSEEAALVAAAREEDYAKPDEGVWGSYQVRVFEVPPGGASEWQPVDREGRWTTGRWARSEDK
jgi:hypothetical protein